LHYETVKATGKPNEKSQCKTQLCCKNGSRGRDQPAPHKKKPNREPGIRPFPGYKNARSALLTKKRKEKSWDGGPFDPFAGCTRTPEKSLLNQHNQTNTKNKHKNTKKKKPTTTKNNKTQLLLLLK